MTDGPWPPARGIPGKGRFKKPADLQFGETPFDDLTRGELLRLVQAYHAAAVSARSVLAMTEYHQKEHPYWGPDGSGGRAKRRLEYLLARCGDGGANSRSERIYRSFFRYATDLLFAGVDGDKDYWGIDAKGEMVAPSAPGDINRFTGLPLRPLKWSDIVPKERTA